MRSAGGACANTYNAGGPLTNIAQAISIDPSVPDLAQELVVMGGSIAPLVPEDWVTENRREFNFWWDPEAVHMVYTAPWHKITDTTVDISVKTWLKKAMIAEIAKSQNSVAQYLAGRTPFSQSRSKAFLTYTAAGMDISLSSILRRKQSKTTAESASQIDGEHALRRGSDDMTRRPVAKGQDTRRLLSEA